MFLGYRSTTQRNERVRSTDSVPRHNHRKLDGAIQPAPAKRAAILKSESNLQEDLNHLIKKLSGRKRITGNGCISLRLGRIQTKNMHDSSDVIPTHGPEAKRADVVGVQSHKKRRFTKLVPVCPHFAVSFCSLCVRAPHCTFSYRQSLVHLESNLHTSR
eukprot:Pompholyxophrys_punicea_v1_NODE_230_length_2663_cov_7.318896.p3 type:complete len:159 gc:universal NODE_230_length_2663_cov_7.318896:1188-712(-)